MLQAVRTAYHSSVLRNILGVRPEGHYSNSDGTSRVIAANLAEALIRATGTEACVDPPGPQRAGALFCEYTCSFLEQSFRLISSQRPGAFVFTTAAGPLGIANYEQYIHLAELQRICEAQPEVEAALGSDYLIQPDIVVGRLPVADEEINRQNAVLAEGTTLASKTPLRSAVNAAAVLHASVSCKWTMRSDRAQNTRTEALNLIRNRKGRSPHIAAVTFEPWPSRLASIAMGTGDVDCTYHAALPELLAAVAQAGPEDARRVLRRLVDGRRLRDISDLPFDLAV